ncbi:MAG TPA: sulfatase [Opitutae bacterium]|nr:sulfatase [Opitutae bacterium]
MRLLTLFLAGSVVYLNGCVSPEAQQAHQSAKPNIVFITVDDLGIMDVGAYNPDCFYETPNIDRFAASAMRFNRAYVSSPVCSPSRYTLMTGKYPSRVHATDWFVGTRSGHFLPAEIIDRMPLEEITIAELLKGAGYATGFIGKWHLGPSQEFYPQNQGFDLNQGGHHRGGPYTGGEYFSPFEMPELKPDSPPGEHLPDRLARETAAFIEANKDRPFLACLNFYSVHTPLMGRPDLVERYGEKAKAVEGVEFGKEEYVTFYHKGKKKLHSEPYRPVRILQKHAIYAAMVEAMDEAVGLVLQQLETLGLAENTIVIVTSDHGGLSTKEGTPTSNVPFRGGKGWLYEGGIRVPFIIRYPGVTSLEQVYEEPVSTLDLYSTLAAAADAPIHHEIDGVDLAPALAGGAIERGPLYWHYPHYSNQGGFPSGAALIGDKKLIQRYEDGGVHLYDLSEDISEQNDIAAEHPKLVEQMTAHLHGWLHSQDARFLRQRPEAGSPKPWRPSYFKP